MRKLKMLKPRVMLLLAIVLSMTVLFASVSRTSQAQSNSAIPSSPSATPVSQDEALRAACAEAVEELKAARQLLKSQGALIERQNELSSLEKQISTGLKDLRVLDDAEKQSLRNAVAAAMRETTAVRAENAVLEKNQVTTWKTVKRVAVGAAAGIIIGFVLR